MTSPNGSAVKTNARALEERLNQSQRLESLGQLAGGIAHDFNNLLAVILNYASFVAEEIPENEAAHADVEQIRIAAERAAGLTRQLLIFGRRETIQPETLDLNAVVAEVQTLLSRTIGEHVELVVDAGQPICPTVRADRGQLEQVLVNLAVNARDAMPDGGTLTIETGVVEFGDRERPGSHIGLDRRTVRHAVGERHGRGHEPGSDRARLRAVLHHQTQLVRAPASAWPRSTASSPRPAAPWSLYSEGGLGTTVRVYLPAG